MALLIDTELLVDLEREDATSQVEPLLAVEERANSVITVSELLHGVHRARGATLGFGVATRNGTHFKRTAGLRVVSAIA